MYPKLGIDTRCVRGTRRVGDHVRMPAQRSAPGPRRAAPGTSRKIRDRAVIARSEGTTGLENRRVESAKNKEESPMSIASRVGIEPTSEPIVGSAAELD